jgi:transketolase
LADKTSDKINGKIEEVIYDDPRKVFANALVELGEINPDVIYVSCDSSLGAGGGEFNKKYPQRHFEFGIAEQNAMGEAAGFAACGKIPFIAAYLPFVAFRCFEQLRDDVCKTKLGVKVMGNNCGFSVSSLGATHTVLEDMAVIRALPNITILSPCDGPEYHQAAFAAAEIDGPVFIRIHRIKSKRLHIDGFKFVSGKGEVLKKGSDVTVVATSTMVAPALEASVILEKKGINAEVLNISTIKPIDADLILSSASKTKKVVSVEEHSIVGGLGSAVAEVLIKQNPVRMRMVGVNDEFTVVGDYGDILDYYGLTPAKIAASIESFVI